MDEKRLKRVIREIYSRLFKAYGPQHWWPAERRTEMIIGQILTQATTWTNVEKALVNLKKANDLSFKALRELPQDKLARLIYPSGYFNVKARKLKAFAEWIGKEYKDNLDRLFVQDINSLRTHLLDVYGIGEESADSIILYAGFKPIFVIDTYTRRIFSRVGFNPVHNNYEGYQKLFMDALPQDTALFNEYHALIVRLGKELCHNQKPDCPDCHLNITKDKAGPRRSGKFPCNVII